MATNLTNGTQPAAADLDRPLYTPIKRRSFFMYAGATAGATALVLAGCKDSNDGSVSLVNVGTGDVGVLNYAYALEQLEAAFYTMVRSGTYYTNTASAAEKAILDDLYYHEVIHRDLFKTALSTNAIKALTPNFGAVDFSNRASVLGTAKAFEDLGVAAYNGAGQYITTPAYLFLAGKIVSVEARHAAVIRDLLQDGTFVDNTVVTLTTASSYATTNPNYSQAGASLERSMMPNDVVTMANNFLADGSKLASPNTF